MRILIIVAAVLLLTGCATLPPSTQAAINKEAGTTPDGLIVKHDAFTGVTSWMYWNTGNVFNSRQTIVIGTQKRGAPPLFALNIKTYSTGQGYMQCHDMHWLVDGRRASFGATHYLPTLSSLGGVDESFEVFVPASVMADLTRATSIRYEICTDAFTFTRGELRGLRDVYAATMAGKP
ncbi:MAG: hypothetical protein ACYC0H_19655 [Solirubrobacteraceae bacterium]